MLDGKKLSNRTCSVLLGVFVVAVTSIVRADTIFESFEAGFGPWHPAADTTLGWYIVPSTDQAHDGSRSVDFSADGRNDDGTLWMVRALELPPGTWNVGLEFHVWSPSGGLFGQWTAIGFIGLREPLLEEDFTQSPEGQDFGAISQLGWQTFNMQRTLQVSEPATAWVAFGYNIVFEVTRTHYFDSVTLTGLPTQCGNKSCFPGEDACNCPVDCGPPPAGELICDDGRDDDCDTAADCIDPDCDVDPVCDAAICDGDGTCETGESPCDCFVDCGPPDLLETFCADGLDNDCDGLIDCADGEFCSIQPPCLGCSTPPAEVSPPGSSSPLGFTSPERLVWEAGSANLADTFNLYRGGLADLPLSYGSCLESAIPTNTTTDPAAPPSASGWSYLVAGENCLGEGTLGHQTAGAERTPVAPCP